MMTLRISVLLCCFGLATSSTSADLIFSLRPVQITGAGTAFTDLVVASDGRDDFAAFGYGLTIDRVSMSAPANGLFFETPVIDEATDPSFNYIFEDDPGDLTSFVIAPDNVQGAGLTGSEEDISLLSSDGQKLVSRIELGLSSSLTSGDTYEISFSPFQATAEDEDGNVLAVSTSGPITFSFGTAAAVPEPSSMAVLLLLAGGVMYRRQRLQR